MMTDGQIEFVEQCIKDDDTHRFYCRKEWATVRERVLRMDHYECQKCKAKGKYTRATLVHHVHHLKDCPDMALEIYDRQGKRNLVSLCHNCHEEEHPEERHKFKTAEPLTEERW